jgi:hypothetical protein
MWNPSHSHRTATHGIFNIVKLRFQNSRAFYFGTQRKFAFINIRHSDVANGAKNDRREFLIFARLVTLCCIETMALLISGSY